MAKLPDTVQQKAADAEVKDFSAFEPGKYDISLVEVDVTKPDGPKGKYWVWKFKVEEGPGKGRYLWMNVSLAEQAAWKVREVYDALGYTLDTDTDEMIGDHCYGIVTQVKQSQGANAGKMVNQLDSVENHAGKTVTAGAAAGSNGATANASADPWS